MIGGTLVQAAEIMFAELHGSDREFEGVSIDSRQVQSGQIFFAFRGAHVDGHDFVGNAADLGAAAAAVTRNVAADLPLLLCRDAAKALTRLAADWRARFPIPVVGITGSNGKTSVKEMLSAILSRQHHVLRTRGNRNNELGVPLTLCEFDPSHQFAVIEMGCGAPGDIKPLAALARPDVAIITNAGPAHLERMGSVAAVARTKGELIEQLSGIGTAILNADDAYFGFWKGMLQREQTLLSFGRDPDASVRVRDRQTADGLDIQLSFPTFEVSVRLGLLGRHNAMNAAAASAAAYGLGVPAEDIRAGLCAYQPLQGRLQLLPQPGGWTLLRDEYNANPASLRAALNALADRQGEKWAVLGDMSELGERVHALHMEAGAEARRLGVSRLFAVGRYAEDLIEGFGTGATAFEDHRSLVEALRRDLRPGVYVLLKGSRAAAMERVLSLLQEGC